jgi:hypothetical protein
VAVLVYVGQTFWNLRNQHNEVASCKKTYSYWTFPPQYYPPVWCLQRTLLLAIIFSYTILLNNFLLTWPSWISVWNRTKGNSGWKVIFAVSIHLICTRFHVFLQDATSLCWLQFQEGHHCNTVKLRTFCEIVKQINSHELNI